VLWKVGEKDHPVEHYEDGTDEIQVLQQKVMSMPTEGSLVVSHRHNVEVLGIQNKALQIEGYLDFYRERLFAGLDVSSVDVGIGNTSSRSTAQTLSRNLIDTVKLQQTVIQDQIASVVEELLLESTFTPAGILDRENLVHLKFHEIDKEAKIADANHLADLFLKNVITHPELRIGIGREPLTPEQEEELWWNKLGREEALIGSVDESSGSGASNSISSKNRPSNQHGQKNSPKLNKDFMDITESAHNPILKWHLAMASTLQVAAARGELPIQMAEIEIRLAYEAAKDEFAAILRNEARNYYGDPIGVDSLYIVANRQAEHYVKKLEKDVISRLKKGMDISVTFESLRYRATLIFDTEIASIRNLARYRWLRANQVDMEVVSYGEGCETCKPKLTTIKWDDKLGEANIPPFHPLCRCGLEVVE
jgi:hypothetical protein